MEIKLKRTFVVLLTLLLFGWIIMGCTQKQTPLTNTETQEKEEQEIDENTAEADLEQDIEDIGEVNEDFDIDDLEAVESELKE